MWLVNDLYGQKMPLGPQQKQKKYLNGCLLVAYLSLDFHRDFDGVVVDNEVLQHSDATNLDLRPRKTLGRELSANFLP